MSKSSHPFTVTHRDIFNIALPASIAFITEPLVGIVDIAVIGRLGDAGLLGGLELGAATFGLLFSMAFFLRTGTAGLTAQAVGAREGNFGLLHLLRAAMVGLILGLVLLFISPLLKMLGLLLFAPPTKGVEDAFVTYLQVRLWAAPFVLINFALLGWFYGRGAAKTGMMLQIGLNGLNILFSIWFVHGLGWGVAGVAAGTVLAEAIIVVASVVVLLVHTRGVGAIVSAFRSHTLFDPTALWRLFDLSRDLMIRSLALMAAFTIFTAQMSRSGEIILASSAVLLNFSMVTAYFLDGQAQAAEFYCGKAVGANYRPAFIQGWHLSTLWGLAIGFGLFIFWLVAGPALIDLLTTNVEVQKISRDYLFVSALIAFSGVIAFVMDGVMAGATMNTIIRNGMLISLVIFIGAVYWLKIWFGLNGLWISLHVFFIVRGIIFWFAVRARMDSLFS